MKNNQLQGKKTIWLTLLLLTIITSLLMSGCNSGQKVYKVGILSGLNFVADSTDGFKEGMNELGYVEGENIIYDVQTTDFDMEAYNSIAAKFVEDEVDMIFVFPTEATMVAKAATEGTDIPVVFSFALVEGMGIIDSVREPGGNITGVRYPGPDFAVRRFEVLMELVPDAKNVLMPYQRGYPIVAPQLEILRPVAEAAGVTLIDLPADNAAELKATLPTLGEFDAILMLVEPLMVTPDSFEVVATYAAENNIPLGGAYIPGGLVLFGVDVISFDSAKLAAPLADKVFKGTQAGTIPVVSADSFLTVDYQVAQQLGLDVPEGLLSLADQVVR